MYYKTQELLEMGSTVLATVGVTAAVLCATVTEQKSIEGIVAGSIVGVLGIVGRCFLEKKQYEEEQRELKFLRGDRK